MNHSHHGPMDMTTAMPMTTMAHSHMDHSNMDHSNMDHSNMDHSNMDHSTMDHSGHGNNTMGHMMMMYFHTGYQEYILFQDLLTKDEGGMVGACVVIFLIAVMYEGLKVFRETLLQKHLMSMAPGLRYESKSTGASQEQIVMQSNMSVSKTTKGGPENGTSVTETIEVGSFSPHSFWSRMLSGGHFIQTLLHVIQVFVSYCLMLVFMTYNVWLCLSVVLGAGIGYFLFGWRRAVVVDSNEHCH